MPAADQGTKSVAGAWMQLRRRTWMLHWLILVGVVAIFVALCVWSIAQLLVWAISGGLIALLLGWPHFLLVRAGFVMKPRVPWVVTLVPDGFQVSVGDTVAMVEWMSVESGEICDTTLEWPGLSGLEPSALLLLKSGLRFGIPAWADGYDVFSRELQNRTSSTRRDVAPPFFMREQ